MVDDGSETHVLADTPQIRGNAPVVSRAWLDACLEAKDVVDAGGYAPAAGGGDVMEFD